MPTKICSKCGDEKDVQEFNKSKTGEKFNTLKDAANKIDMDLVNLSHMLTGRLPNKTPFKYIYES